MLVFFKGLAVNTKDCRRLAVSGNKVELSFMMNCNLNSGYDVASFEFASKDNADEVFRKILCNFHKDVTIEVREEASVPVDDGISFGRTSGVIFTEVR